MIKRGSSFLAEHWLKFVIAVLSIAVGYGALTQNIRADTVRIDQIETRLQQDEQSYITPREYTELIKRLDRIEQKLDDLQSQAPPRHR